MNSLSNNHKAPTEEKEQKPKPLSNLFLSLSLIAALSLTAQPTEFDPNNIELVKNKNLIVLKAVEDHTEEIAAFEFDTKAYLPDNFDPYKGMIVEEAPMIDQDLVTFEFDTEDYLPNGFDPYAGMFIEDELVYEDEAGFDFNTADYLPLGFNANLNIEDYAVVEEIEDAPFDFDTQGYLPLNFDPNMNTENAIFTGLLICDIYPSI